MMQMRMELVNHPYARMVQPVVGIHRDLLARMGVEGTCSCEEVVCLGDTTLYTEFVNNVSAFPLKEQYADNYDTQELAHVQDNILLEDCAYLVDPFVGDLHINVRWQKSSPCVVPSYLQISQLKDEWHLPW